MEPTSHGLVETAALAFAASVAEDGREADARPPDGLRTVTAWCGRKAARVELLLALAEEATQTFELDVALGLLWAAMHGLGNVEEWPNPDPGRIGRRERPLQDRLVAVARQALDRLDTQVGCRELTIQARPEHFEAIIRWIENDGRLAPGAES